MSSVTVASHKHDTYSSSIRYEKHTINNVSDTNNSAACFKILLLRKTGNTMKSAKRHLTAGDQPPGAVRATRRWWWTRPPTPHKDASVGRRHAKDDRHARVSIAARDAVVIVVLRKKKERGRVATTCWCSVSPPCPDASLPTATLRTNEDTQPSSNQRLRDGGAALHPLEPL